MRRLFLSMASAIALAGAVPLAASGNVAIVATSRGVAVAHEGRVDLLTRAGDLRWSAPSVAHATAIVAGGDRVAVLDSIANEVVLANLSDGRALRLRTGETPEQGIFLGFDFFLIARDAAAVQRIALDGAMTTIPVASDPAAIRSAGERLFVYSRVSGVLQEIAGDRVLRRTEVIPFASDMETDGRSVYLTDPRGARIQVIDLVAFRPAGFVAVGAVPVDLALAGGGSALTARILAVADPSAKRIWLTEGSQSMTEAVTRGFLRGLLGLGLFASRSSQFPTGVDRVIARGSRWLAYDSSSGTLYRASRSKSVVLARNIGSAAFDLTGEGAVWWHDGGLHFER